MTKDALFRSPGTKYKRSKIAFAVTSIALTLASLGSKLLQFQVPVHSLIGSASTLVPDRIGPVQIPRFFPVDNPDVSDGQPFRISRIDSGRPE